MVSPDPPFPHRIEWPQVIYGRLGLLMGGGGGGGRANVLDK
jgi:hypothetical protein